MRWLPLLLVACTATKAPPGAAPAEAPLERPPPEVVELHGAAAGVESAELGALLEASWEAYMRRSPVWATSLGDHRFDDQLHDPSARAAEALRELQREWLEAARAIPSEGLTPADQVHRALFIEDLEASLRVGECQFELWSVSPRGNALSTLNFLSELHQLKTAEDGENLLARYGSAPRFVEALVANLRQGLQQGLVANATSVQLLVEMLDAELGKPLEALALARPLQAEREGWTEAEREAFDSALREVVQGEVLPALTTYRDVLRDEVLPVARDDTAPGLASLWRRTPHGEHRLGPLCYQGLVRQYTTLPHSADDLHAIGLDELGRIHEEMLELGGVLFGIDDLQALFTHLREEPELRFDTADEVRGKAEEALERAEAAIPQAFGRLPQARCVVEDVPDYEAPYTTIAYYRRPSPDGSRPGTYYINTYAPQTRPRFEAEVLAYHESIPGHHLQLAIAQELPELPAFRRHAGYTVFVEGWALYTERLADEMGLYSGDLDRLGMLSFDSWRAARLVVDTGLHHKGWSRQEAVDFFRENTPLALNNIDNEIDRYITTPGQAVSYKMGQIEIRALRNEAEATLGERFDRSGFHDAVLGGGSVSLPILREQVDEWVREVMRGG